MKQESSLATNISLDFSLEIPAGQTFLNQSKAISVKLAFSILFALLMAISANSFIYLPFTPVPITMQVMTALLSGIMLGSRWGLASQIIYISLGLSGLPVFAGFKSGPFALAGPTGGYIAGFALAAFITGYLYHNLKKDARFFKNSLIICFISGAAGIIMIHLPGYIHLLGYLYNSSYGTGSGTLALLTWKLGTQPFLIVDFIKLLIIINLFEIRKN